MPFKGTLKSSVVYSLEVTPATSNTGNTAVTAASVIRRDVYREVLDHNFAPNAAPGANKVDDTIQANVTRLVLHVSNPPGGNCRVKLTQSGTTFIEDVVDGDLIYVLNAAP